MISRWVFLLSPAHCAGRRAQLLLRPEAKSPLAVALRGSGATLGELFSFMSGLYFRGKLAYARAFSEPGAAHGGVLVIVPGRGLVRPGARFTRADLVEAAQVEVASENPRYRETLERDASDLAVRLGSDEGVVLLGSIATGKYVDVIGPVLGERLNFPAAFVGRGDMSRGGLMLRHVASGEPLDYVPVSGAQRHGPRPPRLARGV